MAVGSQRVATLSMHVDIRVTPGQRAPVRFTFYWMRMGRWEGRDFQVGIDEARRGEINSTRQE